jgi:hypothetical protein
MAPYSGFPVTRLTTALLVAVLLVPVLGRSSAADEHNQHGHDGNEHNQHGHGGNGHDQRWHGGNGHDQYWHGGNGHDQYWHGDRRFHEQDMAYWRRGHWYHGGHGGRAGWWWIVGGTWYFYPAPVYPYPNPYRPPVVVVAPAPRPVTPYWYYCPNPPGYYPYVPQCLTGWQPVPAVP